MQEHKTIDKIMIKILFSVFTILFTVFIMPIITNRDFYNVSNAANYEDNSIYSY